MSRKRLRRSYSDLGYDWIFFRTTGQLAEKYKILHRTSIMREGMIEIIKKPARKKQFIDLEGHRRKLTPHLEEEQKIAVALNLKSFLRIFDSAPRSYVMDLLKNYFFKNYVFYAYVWLNFYCSEYVYVNFTLHFPIVDWLFSITLFTWPITLDFYFTRLITSIYLPIFVIFIFFQAYIGGYSKLDLVFGFANFFIFFGSIWFYYLTGISFFFYFFFVVFLFFIFFFFFYMVPRRLYRVGLSPPLFLHNPADFRETMLYFPKYIYRFPFKRIDGPVHIRQNFTKFPFLSNQLRAIRDHTRFVFQILQYSKSGKQFNAPIRTKEPLFGSDFNSFYGFDGFAYIRLWIADTTYPVAFPYFFSDYTELDELFEGLKKFIDLPLGVSNTVFFGKNYRQGLVSLYKRHFSSDYDSHDFFFSARMPLWQQNLLKDPYFLLYTWLKFIAPRFSYLEHTSRSIFRAYCAVFIHKIPYPTFNLFLRILYGFIERLLDFGTFCKYYKLPPVKYPFDFYYELHFYLICSRGHFNRLNFVKAICKFLLIFEFRFNGEFCITIPVAEKLAFVAIFARLLEVLTSKIAKTDETSTRVVLLTRVAIRALERVLIALVSSINQTL